MKSLTGVDLHECYDKNRASYLFDFLRYDYKAVVDTQKASGEFTQSVKAFLKSNPKNTGNFALPVLYTLIGIKLLQEVFGGEKAKWKLVVMKAKKWVARELKLESAKKVDELLEKLEMDPY